MEFLDWLLVLCQLLATALLVRKFFKWVSGKTVLNRIQINAAEEASVALGLKEPDEALLVRLRFEPRPVHCVEKGKSRSISGFSARSGMFQPVGGSRFFICTFYRQNPYDPWPLYLHNSTMHDRMWFKAGEQEFFHQVDEEEYRRFKRAGVEFDDAYIVKVTRTSRTQLTAEIFLSGSKIQPVPEVVRSRQASRNRLSKIFF